jgi:hypothetical protein
MPYGNRGELVATRGKHCVGFQKIARRLQAGSQLDRDSSQTDTSSTGAIEEAPREHYSVSFSRKPKQ